MIDRYALDDLILKNNTDDWWQPELFRSNTKALLPAELSILADPPPETENHNCFIDALGLASNHDVISTTHGFIYDTFVRHLLSIGKLKKTNSPAPGDYVVYQNPAQYPNHLTHMGVLQADGTIISKWAWGPRLKHRLWEVPASYGDKVFYIKAISPREAAKLLNDYRDYNLKPQE